MTFQLGASLLDACVLAALRQEDTYGYVLTQKVKNAADISESTLYPVLRRLQTDGCLTTYDMPYQGRNRRYYSLTEQGRERVEGYINDWKIFKTKIDSLLEEGAQ